MRHALATLALGTATALVGGLLLSCAPPNGLADGHAAARTGERRSAPAGLNASERALLDRAEQLLVKRCMGGRGLPYWIVPRLSEEESRSVGYVLDDVAWAGEHGYGSRLRHKELAAKRSDPNLVHRDQLTGQRLVVYTDALYGGPDTPTLSARVPGGGTITSQLGGCHGTALEELYGDRAAWFRVGKIAANLTPLYGAELRRDPRLTSAVTAWSRCMRRAGHPYPDPPAAHDAAAKATAQDGDTAVDAAAERRRFAIEVELAVTEATCAAETGLGRAGRALETEYRDGLDGEYLDALAEHDRIERRALARARDIAGART
ncbi:hypothetical protein [Streptomyces sp. NBC_00572]|uniref:hypothetical protein n=1 Tax=Streptomyces sp. NBC_00572 TaxID=2903664 RepID=UPI0022563243|nr:hypothetical protein [Streptomyces sp. NBC_00572]MCX4982946.1 hypothetical protein [Streptomyces sp. NBC_00572]